VTDIYYAVLVTSLVRSDKQAYQKAHVGNWTF